MMEGGRPRFCGLPLRQLASTAFPHEVCEQALALGSTGNGIMSRVLVSND